MRMPPAARTALPRSDPRVRNNPLTAVSQARRVIRALVILSAPDGFPRRQRAPRGRLLCLAAALFLLCSGFASGCPCEADPAGADFFGPGDLVFSQLDLARLSPEELTAVLGECLRDEDPASMTMTLCREDVLAECVQDGVRWRVSALLVTGPSLPGPRGIVTGMTLSEVLERFGGLPYPEGDGIVYEAADLSRWGAFSQEGSRLTLGTRTEDGRWILTMTFADGLLGEYLLYYE